MRALLLSLIALFVAALLLWPDSASTPAKEAQVPASKTRSRAMTMDMAARSSERVMRRQYALEYSHQVFVDGQDVAPTWVKGVWTTEPLASRNKGKGDERVEVALSDMELDGMEVLPEARAMNTRFQIAMNSAGGLLQLGFAPGTSIEARGLITTLACALWYTPGEGERWTADEDDRSGRYRAVYEWRDTDELVRRREGYLLARTNMGLGRKQAGALTPSGDTRFFFDEKGLREVVVDERIRMDMGEGLPTMEVVIKASLRRLRMDEVSPRMVARMPLEPLRGHGQAGEFSQRELDIRQLGGAGVDELVARLAEVRDIPARSREEDAWRAELLTQLTALLRVNPESAAQIAQALRDNAAGDPRIVSLLAGVLGDAATPEATGVLAQLLAENLPAGIRQSIAASLALTKSPSADSASALMAALDDPEVGSSAALALGAQAGGLADDEPETATTAIEMLLEQYAGASDRNQRITYLNALANSGDPRVLPVLRAAMSGDDSRLAEIATYGLRFIPGSEADELLAAQLDGPTVNEIKVQAVRAIAYRTPADWQERLREAHARYESVTVVRDAIVKVLASWGA